VARSKVAVVLEESHRASELSTDPYFSGGFAKSCLCAPMLRQGECVGVIYLENRALGNAFMDERLRIVDLLASQAAISLQNANLYANMEKRVAERTHALQLALSQVESLSRTDSLTQLPNRGYFMERFTQEVERSKRHTACLGLILLDIDHFKHINDTYGHPAGDAVLRHVARALMGSMRDSDVIGRVGGEEFAELLPQTSMEGAALCAERLRQAVEALRIPLKDASEELRVTVSAGLCVASETPHEEVFYSQADAALYSAKHGGRNQVCQTVYAGPALASSASIRGQVTP
jgi:diguanylate cyclase (GGDEF)-like protein